MSRAKAKPNPYTGPDDPRILQDNKRRVHGAVRQIIFNELKLNPEVFAEEVSRAIASRVGDQQLVRETTEQITRARNELNAIAANIGEERAKLEVAVRRLATPQWITEQVNLVIRDTPAFTALKSEALKAMEDKAKADVRAFIDANFSVQPRATNRKVLIPVP